MPTMHMHVLIHVRIAAYGVFYTILKCDALQSDQIYQSKLNFMHNQAAGNHIAMAS